MRRSIHCLIWPCLHLHYSLTFMAWNLSWSCQIVLFSAVPKHVVQNSALIKSKSTFLCTCLANTEVLLGSQKKNVLAFIKSEASMALFVRPKCRQQTIHSTVSMWLSLLFAGTNSWPTGSVFLHISQYMCQGPLIYVFFFFWHSQGHYDSKMSQVCWILFMGSNSEWVK